jgi:hypothetical protein
VQECGNIPAMMVEFRAYGNPDKYGFISNAP